MPALTLCYVITAAADAQRHDIVATEQVESYARYGDDARDALKMRQYARRAR